MARLFKGPAVVGFAPLRARCAHPPLREAHDDFNRGFYRKNVTLTFALQRRPTTLDGIILTMIWWVVY